MYFLGIDPGVRKLGFALIDNKMNIKDAGIILIEEKSPTREDNFSRIQKIYEYFEKVLVEHKITSVGIEKLFFTRFNQANAEFVFGVRAVLILLFLKHNIQIFEYTPLQLKKHITGNGKAEKILMQQFIMKLYGLRDLPKFHDSADALGLAYLVSKK